MKHIINFSDFHMHFFKDFSKPDAIYGTDRAKEQIKVLKDLMNYAREVKGDVLFNGDLFHKRVSIDVRIFNMMFEVFSSYPDVPIIMVSGNHDKVTNALASDSALEAFNALPNVTVISTMEKLVRDEYTLYGVSYGEEVDEMKEWIAEEAKKLDPNTINILCAHIGVDGSSTGQYSHTLSGAFKVADLYPDNFDIVTLGHYHKRQFLGGLSNVFYVGNTLQTSFADEGQAKGFMDITLDGKEWSMKFVKANYTPFMTVTADTVPEDLSGAFIQFVGNVTETEAVKKLKEDNDLSNLRIKVQKDYYVPPRIEITAGSTPEEVVRAFTDKKYPDLQDKALECLRIATEI